MAEVLDVVIIATFIWLIFIIVREFVKKVQAKHEAKMQGKNKPTNEE